MRVTRVAAILTALVASVTGCGGGGGHALAPTVRISSANAERVAAIALLGATVDQVAGGLEPSFFNYPDAGDTFSSGRVDGACHPTVSVPTGTITSVMFDVDNDHSFGLGDRIENTYAECFLATYDTTFGGIIVSRPTAQPSGASATPTSRFFDVSFRSFASTRSGAKTVTVDGTLKVALDLGGIEPNRITTTSGKLKQTVGSVSWLVENPSLTWESESNSLVHSIWGSAIVTSEVIGGSVRIDIAAADRLLHEITPALATGMNRVRRADESTITLTGVINSTPTGTIQIQGLNSRMVLASTIGGVRLKVDENNDSVFEIDRTLSWEDLRVSQ